MKEKFNEIVSLVYEDIQKSLIKRREKKAEAKDRYNEFKTFWDSYGIKLADTLGENTGVHVKSSGVYLDQDILDIIIGKPDGEHFIEIYSRKSRELFGTVKIAKVDVDKKVVYSYIGKDPILSQAVHETNKSLETHLEMTQYRSILTEIVDALEGL